MTLVLPLALLGALAVLDLALLCFGKAITLQSLVPPRTPQKRKRRKVRKLPPEDAAQ